jgi:hypothetical protein
MRDMKKIYLSIVIALLVTSANAQNSNSPDLFSTASNRTSEPVSNLANFRANEYGNSIQIIWNALTESNLLRHEIERSANGSGFSVIGAVTAQNSITPVKYNFLDASPTQGNNYYRLRSVNRSGDVTYSPVLNVNMGTTRKTSMTVLSNPVRDKVINLQLSNIQRGRYAITIFNNAGQRFYAQSMDLSDGSLTEIINLPSTVSRGTYFVQLTNGAINVIKQIVVL